MADRGLDFLDLFYQRLDVLAREVSSLGTTEDTRATLEAHQRTLVGLFDLVEILAKEIVRIRDQLDHPA